MPRSRRLIITAQAERDLQDIYEHTLTHWGESQVTAYRALLLAGMKRIAANPRLGAFLPQRTYRSYVVGAHRLLYRQAEDEIHVLAVRHQRRRLPRRL